MSIFSTFAHWIFWNLARWIGILVIACFMLCAIICVVEFIRTKQQARSSRQEIRDAIDRLIRDSTSPPITKP